MSDAGRGHIAVWQFIGAILGLPERVQGVVIAVVCYPLALVLLSELVMVLYGLPFLSLCEGQVYRWLSLVMAVALDPCTRLQIIAIDQAVGATLPFSVKVLAHRDRGGGGVMLWNAFKLVWKQLRRTRHQVLSGGNGLRCADNFPILHRKNFTYILITLPILSREVWLQVHSCMLSN